MRDQAKVPSTAYGVLLEDRSNSELDEVAEKIRRLGYAVLDSGYSPSQLSALSIEFNRTRQRYLEAWGQDRLQALQELHTIRAPLAHGGPEFLQLVTNQQVLSLIKLLIGGKFVLNQQNGVINPPGESYNQGAWHRDLPYQHFISSSPLAINALFCVDDFTTENGATFVLPASHKSANFASRQYIANNAVQVEAKAGQFIVLDCMLFHSGGFNRSKIERRAVNHVYSIPYFKQQIKLADLLKTRALSKDEIEILGLKDQEPNSIEDYFATRQQRIAK